MINGQRPWSIAEVAGRTAAGQQGFDMALSEFLDAFYLDAASRQQALDRKPPALSPLRDAYLAATAEYLAAAFGLTTPEWTERHGFDVDRPFFAGGLETLKALLLVQSPAAFRRRLLFVSPDALSRPRQLSRP